MKKNLAILLLEDSPLETEAFDIIFRRLGHVLLYYSSAVDLISDVDELKEGLRYDIAVIDRANDEDVCKIRKRYSGDEAINKLRLAYPDKPIICISGYEIDKIKGAGIMEDIDLFVSKFDATDGHGTIVDFWQRVIEQAFEKASWRTS